MFAVGKSTVLVILRDTMRAINNVLRHEISWLMDHRILETQNHFKILCGLPGIIEAIDGTHIHISKPQVCLGDYFYLKLVGYILKYQAVVDSRKRFLDLYLGMPGSRNDAWVLHRSSFYRLANNNNFFDLTLSMDGFMPYLLGDSGYPLLPWLMVPHQCFG